MPAAEQSLWRALGRVARQELRVPQRAVQAIARALPPLTFNRVRTAILRASGLEIGSGSLVFGSVTLTGTGNRSALLSVGADAVLTGPLRVELCAPVRIGNRVYLGQDVRLATCDRSAAPSAALREGVAVGAISVGDGAWLGSRVVVLPGVSIGAGSIVAAGSVVTEDVMPNTLVGGVPARVLRVLELGAPAHVRSRRTHAI